MFDAKFSFALIVLLVALCFVAAPLRAGAQEPVKAFDLLSTRLKPGDTVWVTAANGREIKGKIVELTSTALVLGSGRTFDAATTRVIREAAGSSTGKGALWGAVAGAGLGVAVSVVVGHTYEFGCLPGSGAPPSCPPVHTVTTADWWGVPILSGVGAGLGALVGGLLPGKKLDVYRAPATASSPRLSLAPMYTPHTGGAQLSFAF